MPPERFLHVSAKDVRAQAPQALALLKHRIVIVGSNRHKEFGYGDWVDNYESPMGIMRGIFFHGNYVEALLDSRMKIPVPSRLALFLDLALGVLIIWATRKPKKLAAALLTASVFLIPLIAAYVVFVNLNYCLDFVLPLALLPLHVLLEDYFHFRFQQP